MSTSFPVTFIFFVLCCAIGMILNFSSLVLILIFFQFFFIPSISLSTFSFITKLDFQGDVNTCAISSSYIVSQDGCVGEGRSFVKSV